MIHQVVIAPDFDLVRMRGVPTDWRPGVRVAIVMYGLAPGRASTLFVIIVLAGVVACGAAWGAMNGTVIASLRTSVIIAAALAACYGALAVLCRVTMPEEETVIDWKLGQIMRRRGRVWQKYPLEQLKEVKVASEPDTSGATLALQLLVANQFIPLLATDRCESIAQAFELIGLAAKHLATTLNKPLTVPNGLDPEQVSRDKRQWSNGYVETGKHSVLNMKLAQLKGDAQEAERHRGEAMDYFDIANRIEPTNPTPLLELSRLSNDDRVKEQAIELAVSAAPDSSVALIELGRMQDRQGHSKLAKQSFDEAVRLDRCIATLTARALFRQLQERFCDSIQDYSEAIDLAGEDDDLADLLDSRADCYYVWYESSEDQHYLDLAIEDLRQAVSLDADKSTSLCRLLIEAESHTEAIALLDDLIGESEESYAYGLRGQAFLEQGVDMDSAVRDFTRAIEMSEAEPTITDPQWAKTERQGLAWLYTLRGEAHQAKGDLFNARRDSEKSLELDPE